MENNFNIFQQFSNFMNNDTRGVEVVSYGIAGISLLSALYKIRPFAKFITPTDLPKHFLKKNVLLEGTVKSIVPAEQPYLLVDHKPIISFPRLGTQTYLPIKIAGVNISGNGISWLQIIVKEQKITFLPIDRDNECLTCIVTMPQKHKKPLSVGRELIKIGFGTVQEVMFANLLVNKNIKIYERSLQLAQKWAKRKRNGIWHSKYNPTISWKMTNSLDNKFKAILPISFVKYFNI